MYMSEGPEGAAPPRVPKVAMAALAISVAILLYLGVLPSRLIELAASSVATIF
jgi:hypothetical protein